MDKNIVTLASILEVYANLGNQEYYNKQAETVKRVIDSIIADRNNNNIKGAILLGITACVVPNLNKKGNPFWDKPSQRWNLLKQFRLTGVIGFDYTRSVNNRLVKEDKEPIFEALPRQWGTAMDGATHFIEHTNKEGVYRRYLSVAVSPLAKPKVEYYTVSPTLRIVDPDDFAEFVKPESEGRQGLDNKLIYRDFGCDSLNTISYKGIVQLRDILRELAGENLQN